MPGEQLGSEYKGPGPVLHSRGKRTKNKTKPSQTGSNISHVITQESIMTLYMNLLIATYTTRSNLYLEDCYVDDKYIFLIFFFFFFLS